MPNIRINEYIDIDADIDIDDYLDQCSEDERKSMYDSLKEEFDPISLNNDNTSAQVQNDLKFIIDELTSNKHLLSIKTIANLKQQVMNIDYSIP